jgi:hypothetical protein
MAAKADITGMARTGQQPRLTLALALTLGLTGP